MYAQNERKRIIPLRMIPYGDRFDHLLARTIFGMNDLALEWQPGTPMPPNLVPEILRAMGLPEAAVAMMPSGAALAADAMVQQAARETAAHAETERAATAAARLQVEREAAEAEPQPEPAHGSSSEDEVPEDGAPMGRPRFKTARGGSLEGSATDVATLAKAAGDAEPASEPEPEPMDLQAKLLAALMAAETPQEKLLRLDSAKRIAAEKEARVKKELEAALVDPVERLWLHYSDTGAAWMGRVGYTKYMMDLSGFTYLDDATWEQHVTMRGTSL